MRKVVEKARKTGKAGKGAGKKVERPRVRPVKAATVAQELKALGVMVKDQDRVRELVYRHFRQKDYLAMAGTDYRTLREFGVRTGAPVTGKELDLYAVIKWLHEAVKEGGGRKAGSGAAEVNAQRARLLRLQVAEKEGQLVMVEDVREEVQRLGEILRKTAERLQKEFGPVAGQMVVDALEQFVGGFRVGEADEDGKRT